MSGHSKWSTIKHKKAASDARRGKVFSKMAKEIMVVARSGGPDPSANITLRSLIQKARSYNMPADNIERAIKKGTGDGGGAALEEMLYEGFAAGGVAVIVEVLTDNRNRSAAEVRHLFNKHGANMATPGSVSRGFRRRGQIVVPGEAVEEDRLLEQALDAGAEDMEREGGRFLVSTDPGSFSSVMDAFQTAGIPVEESEVAWVAETTVPVSDPDQAGALIRFMEALDDLDDVQNVYTNMDLDEDLANRLTQE